MGFEITSRGVLKKYSWEKGDSPDLIIPDSVKVIGEKAFENRIGIFSLTIPEGVTAIRQYAFRGCGHLEKLTIPSTMQSIDERAINKTCYSLAECIINVEDENVDLSCLFEHTRERFTVSDSNKLYSCFDGALYSKDMTHLIRCPVERTRISISDKCNTISQSAFSRTKIEEIIIPKNVETIEERAFHNCEKLRSVTIENGVKRIGKYAFLFCDELKQCVIPPSVISVGADAFDHGVMKKGSVDKMQTNESFVINGDVLEEYITPDSAISCCEDEGCENVAEYIAWTGKNPSWAKIKVPGTIKAIGVNAFCSNDYISSITLSEGVEEVGNNAFEDCLYLNSVSFPQSIRKIGNGIFKGCGNLKSISFYKGGKKKKLDMHWLDGDLEETYQIDLVCSFIVAASDSERQAVISQIKDSEIIEQLKKM